MKVGKQPVEGCRRVQRLGGRWPDYRMHAGDRRRREGMVSSPAKERHPIQEGCARVRARALTDVSAALPPPLPPCSLCCLQWSPRGEGHGR